MLAGFDYHRPEDDQELRSLLPQLDGNTTLLAGGTDVLVQMRNRRLRPEHLVDLGGIEAYRGVRVSDGGVLELGATVTVTDMVRHPHVRRQYQALVEGGRAVGSVQIQNRATLVGNICNASPAADTVPALLLFEALLRVAGTRGERWVPVREFLRGPGLTAAHVGEWVEGIRLPASDVSGSCYLKLGRTRALDIALVGVACRVSANKVSFSFASVAPTAVHLDLSGLQDPSAGELTDGAMQAIRDHLRPIDDVRASAAYRTETAVVLARRALREAQRRFDAVTEAV